MKKFMALTMLSLSLVTAPTTVFAHKEDEGQEQQQQEVQAPAVYNITREGTVVTFKTEAGEPIPDMTVRVKDENDDPDVTIDNGTTDANGQFDYGPYVDKGAAILRVTNPANSNTILYYVETGEHVASAGKSKSGDGSSGSSSSSKTVMYASAGAGVLVAAGIGGVVMNQQKKKKEFEAKKKANKKKK
ncbi:MAG: hypothetical protein ATN35_13125 [Epulopiscium sp. Nele67-Bin004]|nr:MAG: hypothetical protein ATN35_13125 [Epulopiscium sp. Nele67-Bin004]